ncbi:MAG: aspartyl/glutamyl-tRNA amidotransferase subunit C, partial [Gammaproteobacteria bacterium]|nr:aspartyl/glutamyl-tRNA amidotransferase subunit C [Gammaproteobacteria bacterium]
MSVNTETVQHVAKLSMLNIGDDEISSTTERINKVLALV